MTNNDSFGVFDALRTPERIWDIKKLLSASDFPIYILIDETLDFQLRHIDLGSHGHSRQDARLYHVSLAYISPTYTEYNQAAVISNLSSDDESIIELSLLNAIRNMRGFLPKGTKALSSLGGFWKSLPTTNDDFIQQEEWIAQMMWEPHIASGLEFKLFHQQEPEPYSLAYSDGEKGKVIVVSIGMPRANFLIMLSSLVCLQENEILVDQLQRDLKTAHEEMDRILDQELKSRGR